MTTFLADPRVHEALMNILSAVALALGTLVGILIKQGVTFLTAKINNEHNVLYAAVADRLVKYAEAKFSDQATTEKADYVASQLTDKFPALKSIDVSHLTEQAVSNMKIAMTQPAVNLNVTAPPITTVTETPVLPAKGVL